MANEWARRCRREDTAVIIFKTNCEILSNKKECIFQNDCKAWKEVVQYFRSKKDRRKSNTKAQKAKEFNQYDYIFGPIADGGIYQRTFPPNPIKPIKYQLCLKNQDLADEFFNEGNNVEEVIFFCDN